MKRAVLYFRVGWQSCCLSVRALWSLGRLQSEAPSLEVAKAKLKASWIR